MVGAGVARGPGVPWAGTFLETNVRLYSVDDDRPPRHRLPVPGHRPRAGRGRGAGGVRAALPLGPDAVRRHRRPPHVRRPPAPSRDPADQPRRGPGRRPPAEHPARRLPQRPVGAARALVGPHPLRAQHATAWPLREAEALAVEDGLMASVGLAGLASRPPGPRGVQRGCAHRVRAARRRDPPPPSLSGAQPTRSRETSHSRRAFSGSTAQARTPRPTRGVVGTVSASLQSSR